MSRHCDEIEYPIYERIDTRSPQAARVWNCWLGGKDHYPIDQFAAQAYAEHYSTIAAAARYSRVFQGRAVGALTRDYGVRQFLDIGCGLPAADNTHEIAQREAPTSRIVYVDNDPLVLSHACALMASGPDGACGVVEADVRDTSRILSRAAETVDLAQPVGLLMLNVLGHIPEYGEASAIVGALIEELVPGSFLVLNDGTNTSAERVRAAEEYNRVYGSAAYHLREPEQITGYFSGLELLAPGIVATSHWRMEDNPWGAPAEIASFCGVGRKP